jgi:hypothetical protein
MDEWINVYCDTSDEEEIKANKILKQPLCTYDKPQKQINLNNYYINICLIILLYLKIYYPTILLEWL